MFFMFKFKSFLFAAVALVPLVFTACGSGSASINEDAEMEMAYFENSTFVFGIDYSDSSQIEDLAIILGKLPETGAWEMFKSEFAREMGDDMEEFEEMYEAVFTKEFEVGVSVALPDDVTNFSEIDAMEVEDLQIVIVGEFEGADAVDENFDEFLAEENPNVEVVDQGGLKTWTVEEEDLFAARYGDIFFMTNTDDNRKNILDRLDEGKVVFTGARTDLVKAPKLGYMHMDLSFIFELLEGEEDDELNDLLSVYGLEGELMDMLNELYFALSVDEDGFKVSSVTGTSGDTDSLGKIIPGITNKLTLVDKVNAEGVFFYVEDQDLGFYLETIMNSFDSLDSFSELAYSDGLYGDVGLGDVVEDIVSGGLFVEVMSYLSDFSGVASGDIEDMLHAPFAFSASNVNDFLPGFAFYLDLSDETVETAKQFSAGVDEFVIETIVEFNALIPSDIEGKDAIRREEVEVDGGVLYKAYIDWEAFSEETRQGWTLGLALDMTDFNIELYYGVFDDVLLVALAPDFVETFAKGSLSDDPDYKDGVAKLGDSYGYNVTYFNSEPLINFFNTYIGFARLGGFVTDSDMDEYNLYVNEFFGSFKYLIASKAYADGELLSDMYLKVE
jgi:hypothetical protein